MFSKFGYDSEVSGTEIAVLVTLFVLAVSSLVVLAHGG